MSTADNFLVAEAQLVLDQVRFKLRIQLAAQILALPNRPEGKKLNA